jgi:hypothetical protein
MSKRQNAKPARFLATLSEAIDKFEINSPVSFSFAGEAQIDTRDQSPVANWGMQPANSFDPLVSAIQNALYTHCYARWSGPATNVPPDPEFPARLSAANAGHERWDPGWAIQQFGPMGQAFVRKGDHERLTNPGAYIFDGVPGQTAQIGQSVSVRAARETFAAQQGYYYAFGEELDEMADQLLLMRIYFNVSAAQAAGLVEALTRALNRYQTPFQFKVPAAPHLYGRADAGVLYIGLRYLQIAARLIEEIRSQIEFTDATPLFTKTLWPGVGAAVEPGTGESFGSHRCRLTAEGLVDAWRQGEQTTPARLVAIRARFEVAGLDLARPWLGPNGVDHFEAPQKAKLP